MPSLSRFAGSSGEVIIISAVLKHSLQLSNFMTLQIKSNKNDFSLYLETDIGCDFKSISRQTIAKW